MSTPLQPQVQAIVQGGGDWPGPGGGWPGGGGHGPHFPQLVALTPNNGPTTGGNTVSLLGSNLQSTFLVTFDGIPATIVGLPTQNTVTVIAPAHAAGTVLVVAFTPKGPTNSLPYTYIGPPAPPVIGSFTPPSGPTTGGTMFTILGANLTGATVTFNGIPATGVTVNALGTSLTGFTPPGAAGTVPVVVTTPGGSATTTFTYFAPAPTVSTFVPFPFTGPLAGGNPFAITGTNLTGATVTFGANAATSISIHPSGTLLTGIVPAGAAPGNVPVVVTTPGGSFTIPGGYTYV
ncbi:IPT/TIG domain-containing protein [Streptomyces pathocidini]|uniref:IPT/TIG domain-containing protein n=2 Tax=Streptomyces pathocidini TaxID=1650571 RepID=A0ABW7UJE1_9ACTN